MRCMYCGCTESKVVDSRPTEDGWAIRRRRECMNCGKRFTTYEKVDNPMVLVVKKDGRRQTFDRNKVLNGMVRACEKRPVPVSEIEKLVQHVETSVCRKISESRSQKRCHWIGIPDIVIAAKPTNTAFTGDSSPCRLKDCIPYFPIISMMCLSIVSVRWKLSGQRRRTISI